MIIIYIIIIYFTLPLAIYYCSALNILIRLYIGTCYQTGIRFNLYC
jgi:hypothetical protein